MATREENLKKINAELENLSDEELEIVAGGSKEETDEIIKLFKRAKSCGRIGFNNLNEFLSYAGINANMNDTENDYETNPHNLADPVKLKKSSTPNSYNLISTGLGRSHRETVAILKEFYALD